MAYSRLVEVVTDYALGYQSINQCRDNLDAILLAADVEHFARDVAAGAEEPGRWWGRHNTPKVPRAVGKVTVYLTPGNRYTAVLGGASASVGPIRWEATGVFFAEVYGLTEFYAVCQPHVSVAVNRFIVSRPWYPVPPQKSGIYFACYELISGVWTLTDYDFCMTLYGVV